MVKVDAVGYDFERRVSTMAKISAESIEKMSKLIGIAREQGKVIHVSEAFEKYPVEDEFHEDTFESFVQEETYAEV